MRRAARIDDNQKEIVKALRNIGASVKHTHMVKGFVDIVVSYRQQTYLIEIKDGKKKPSARRLTPDEQDFHDNWQAPVYVVESIAQALDVVLHNPPKP